MPGAEGSDCRLSGVKVLAAEDNELNAEILRELLHMNGMVCDIVSNGQELLDAFEKSGSGQYDLILTDIQMPVMNGYDAVRAIRAAVIPCEDNSNHCHDGKRVCRRCEGIGRCGDGRPCA